MNPLLLAVVLIGGFLVVKGVSNGSSGATIVDTNPQVTRQNSWGLPDIDSTNQGGTFDTTYDESYEKASGATGVPFALIKAHAIRESAQVPTATHTDTSGDTSFGLLQVEWNQLSASSLYNRLAKYGAAYSGNSLNPVVLEDPDTSAYLGASIMADNLNWLAKGGIQGLRDTINAYNTGTTEAKSPAPNNYVNDVIANYAALIGETVTC